MTGEDTTHVKTIHWVGGLDGWVEMIEQTLLPEEFRITRCDGEVCVYDAIQRLAVRGAPAIGIAAAMGLVLGVREFAGDDASAFRQHVGRVSDYLAGSRPTAVNLFWALKRMQALLDGNPAMTVAQMKDALLAEAKLIRDEDAAMCRAIGETGAHVVPDGGGVLTHCNAGGLATAEYGTALAVMFRAHELGKRFTVYADETRPLLQGSRLTAWELGRAGIDVKLICDNTAAQVMKEGRVGVVVTGADRVAGNGDAANKIGTYGVAVLAHAHGIPFYIAAPTSTFDRSIPDGSFIPIEERSPDEVRRGFGRLTAPEDTPCYCPAFDVTPANLIRGIITERGVIEPVTTERVAAVLGAA